MKVADLIALLQTLPGDVPVFQSTGGSGNYDVLLEVVGAEFNDGTYALATKGYAKPFVEIIPASACS